MTAIVIERDARVALLIVNRPDKLNALDNALVVEIHGAVKQLSADAEVGAIILTGAGDKAFVAGADISVLAKQGVLDGAANSRLGQSLTLAMEQSPKPILAAINGYALGGGLELALACTFRVAAPGVRLSLPEIKLGVLPSYAGTQLLPAVVGTSRALDLMLTGRAVDAEEALALGLVDRVATAPSSLLEEAAALADSILAHSQFAIDRLRRCVAAAGAVVTDAGLAVEAQAVEETMQSEDAREGVVAFLQKRQPNFKHR